MILLGERPDPIPRESDVLTSERREQAALADAEDRGGLTRINGKRYDDVPSWDEL